jgi:galactokinase
MANALARETSPYLRQHQDNPVDWLPWGETALERARTLDRPLLVSIGYSACHWCHVMEHESFEDPEVAATMNAHFVCVKVDREERPDIDAIYMEAVQTLTGQGGWPLNVFLTPAQEPFWAGTYFPPAPRHGMPSWPQVLAAIAAAWRERRAEVGESATRLARRLVGAAGLEPAPEPIDPAALDRAVAGLRASFDARHGGFGGAPKFPPTSAIEFLLGRGETEMSLATLRAMAAGGIHDQVGGGFSRYAVDATWTVPHFEKMLYDNALLARAYLHGWLRSGDELLLRTARETLDFCLRELRAPDGGFYAALDADSEGVEGRFYVWTVDELRAVLGPDLAGPAIDYFGATEAGNFDGANVLEARGPEPAEREEIRARLLAARAARVRPGLDDKRLWAWNGLIVSALAEAGAVLEEPRYVEAAADGADFLLRELRDADGRLLRHEGARALTAGRVVAFAPGRVNLIGEHTDYNDGLALPFAVARGVTVTATRLTRGAEVEALAHDLGEADRFPLVRPGPAAGWRAYVRGVVAELQAAGHELPAVRLEIAGTIPSGSGLSSSAALEVALGLALLGLVPDAGDPDRLALARLCARVEHRWAGVESGLLDPLASLFGAAGMALRIDFRTLERRPVGLDLGDWELATVDSGESHALAASGYNERRAECDRARDRLGLESLRSATLAQLADLGSPLDLRVRHTIEENRRVEEMVAALAAGDRPAAGRLLDASHASLRDLYAASTPRVEETVAALKAAGAAGARMVGGGFGGHVLALFPPGRRPPSAGEVVVASAGARLLDA